MKKVILMAPLCVALLACEKEQKKEEGTNQEMTSIVSHEQLDLTVIDRPDATQMEDRVGGGKEKVNCPMNQTEQNGSSSDWSGQKCVLSNYVTCGSNTDKNSERCKSRTGAMNTNLSTNLTPQEIQQFWSGSYNEQFVRDNWTFFMTAYEQGELLHPNDIIQINFR